MITTLNLYSWLDEETDGQLTEKRVRGRERERERERESEREMRRRKEG
jgi:hypothetical protein